MKIVDRKTFLAMPAGTVFSKYEPCFFGELCIKGESLHTNDFLEQQIADSIECSGSQDFSDKLNDAAEFGGSLAMDFNCQGRDGCFEGDKVMFAVWERQDVCGLISRLRRALRDSQG